MKYAIIILPTLLTIGSITAVSIQASSNLIDGKWSDRAAEVKHLRHEASEISARLSVLATPHNFLPRGMSATRPHLLADASRPLPADGRRQP